MLAPFDILDFASPGATRYNNLRSSGAGNLQFTTALGIGCETATFSLPATGLEPSSGPLNGRFGVGHDIWIMDAKGCVWRGKVSLLRYSERSRSWYVEAHGYGKDLGGALDDVVNARNTATSALIGTSAITALTTMIDDTDITTGSYTVSNTGDVLLPVMTAARIIAWAGRFDIDPEWYVYPEDDGTRLFTYRPRPAAPTIYLYTSSFPDAEWGFEDEPLYNTVLVHYNRGGTLATPTYSFATDTDTALEARYGVLPLAIRMWELVASADADQVVASALSGAKYPRMSATSLRTVARSATIDGREPDIFIASRLGSATERIAPHRLRAGELMSFLDVEAQEEAANTDFNKVARISRTTYIEDTQELIIEPENFGNTVQSIARRYEAMALGFVD